MLAGDAERLAEASRPGCEQPNVVEPAPLAHELEAVGRLERPDQHRCGAPFLLADEVQAPVDPVGAVDVRVPGRSEHRRVARRAAAEAVRGGILGVVRLDLDDPAADAVDEERDADQLGRDLVDAAGEELDARSFRTAARTRRTCWTTPAACARAGPGRRGRHGRWLRPRPAAPQARAPRRAAASPRRLLSHVVQDRPLGAGGDDRIGDALDPDERPLAAAAAVAGDRLERVDPVGAGVLAEAEEDHARSRRPMSGERRREHLGDASPGRRPRSR